MSAELYDYESEPNTWSLRERDRQALDLQLLARERCTDPWIQLHEPDFEAWSRELGWLRG